MHQVFFALSIAILGILAYFIRDWRSLTIATCLPAVFGLFVFPMIPESPRWLASQGRTDEAEEILHKVAVENGLGDRHVTLRQRKQTSNADSSRRTYGIVDLFMNKNTCVITCVMILSWFVNSHVYYGLSLNVKNLGGNMYANFIFAGLVEIPSYMLSVILLSWLGRRKSLFFFMMGTALSCWTCMNLQRHEVTNAAWLSAMAMLGKFCISASFAVIYVYTSELFPTVIRNVALGTTTVASRLGGISCPFVVLLGEQSKSLPMFVFAFLSLVAGMAGLKLPETKGQPMPETMEDLEKPEVVEVKGTTQA